MPKRRGHAGRRLELDDVLAGRARPDATSLLDLIHRVNPTGRELPPREAELRYRQKARLQSLLVRSFAAETTVVADPAREGTVSLFHRGRDACHAVTAELEDDARAWVQLQVDLGPGSEPAVLRAHPPEVTPAAEEDDDDETPAGLVRRASGALATFDYEAARALLERATAGSGGAAEPAAALVSLLVETLGDDAAALALMPSLSRAALADPRVRAALAMAAARSGDEERATALLRGAGELQVAAVLAALAGAALASGDSERAAGFLTRARARDAAHPAIAPIAGEIARERAAARRSVEADLGHLVKAGLDDEAERAANEVLARWPESEAAGRALRTVAERRRHRETERLAAEAKGALARGDAAEALARMARALGALGRGAEREALEREMARVEAAERARREEATVLDARRRFEAPDPREGLLAYLDLPPSLRSRLLQLPALSARREEIARLDLAADGRGSHHHKVDAVLALSRAQALVAGDPEGAVALLEAHLGPLERVPEARRVLDEARAGVASRRVARARDLVRASRAALAAGDAAAAVAAIPDAALRDLPEDDRAEAEELRARASAAAARSARIVSLAKLRATGRLFEARALCDELADGAVFGERPRWEAERRAIQDGIQALFRVEVDHDPEPIAKLPILLWKLDLEETVRALTADGATMILAEPHRRWILVRVIAWETEAVRTTVLLRTPEPVGTIRIELRGPRLWLIGEAAIELSIETWEVLTWRSAAELVPPPDLAWDIVLAGPEDPAAPRYLWALSGSTPRPETPRASMVRVLDVDRRRVARDVPDTGDLVPIMGGDEPRIGCVKVSLLTVHEARGVPGMRIERPGIVRAMTRRPDGAPGFVILGGASDDDVDHRLPWYEVSPDGVVGPPTRIDDSNGRTHATVAVSREAGMMYMVVRTPAGSYELLGFRPTDRDVPGNTRERPPIEQVWRVPVPTHTLLVQDAASRRIVTLHVGADTIDVALLGTEPPPPPPPLEGAPSPLLWFPTPLTAVSCGAPFGEREARIRDLAESFPKLTLHERTELIRRQRRELRGRPASLLELSLALDRAGADADGGRLLSWIEELWPEAPALRLRRAGEILRRGRFPEVLSTLEGLTAGDFSGDPGSQRHLCHVIALASAHTGDLARARAALTEARGCEGHCELDPLEELVEGILVPDPKWEESDFVTRFVIMMRVADAALDDDDPLEALELLARTRNVNEVQSLARRSEAYLQTEPENRHEHLHMLLNLARLIELSEQAPLSRPVIPLGDATWSAERIADVVARARAWLTAAGLTPE